MKLAPALILAAPLVLVACNIGGREAATSTPLPGTAASLHFVDDAGTALPLTVGYLAEGASSTATHYYDATSGAFFVYSGGTLSPEITSTAAIYFDGAGCTGNAYLMPQSIQPQGVILPPHNVSFLLGGAGGMFVRHLPDVAMVSFTAASAYNGGCGALSGGTAQGYPLASLAIANPPTSVTINGINPVMQ